MEGRQLDREKEGKRGSQEGKKGREAKDEGWKRKGREG